MWVTLGLMTRPRRVGAIAAGARTGWSARPWTARAERTAGSISATRACIGTTHWMVRHPGRDGIEWERQVGCSKPVAAFGKAAACRRGHVGGFATALGVRAAKDRQGIRIWRSRGDTEPQPGAAPKIGMDNSDKLGIPPNSWLWGHQ